MNIAIVRSKVYEEYTDQMLDYALEQADEIGVEVAEVLEVTGTHDIPVPAAALLEREDIDAVVALGITITSPTDHNEVLAHNVSKQLLELGCEYKKPVGNGVIGPKASWAEVERRIEAYSTKSVKAVVRSEEELQRI